MTDEELRNLIASTAQATAANTAGLAESRRVLDEGLARSQQLIDANTAGFAETWQLISSNARATEANSDAITKLAEKVDQIDDAVMGLYERLNRLANEPDRLGSEFNHRFGQLIDLHLANAREHADFVARGQQHDRQIQMLIEENRADRQGVVQFRAILGNTRSTK